MTADGLPIIGESPSLPGLLRATALCPSFVATDLTTDVTKVARAEMIRPDDLAELAARVIALPNSASVAELLVNCRFEDTL